VFRKGGDLTQLFQQHIAAWKIRFFIEIVIRKNQIQSFKDEVAGHKKQIKLLQKKLEDSRDKLKEVERIRQLEEEVTKLRSENEKIEENQKQDRKREIEDNLASEFSMQNLRDELGMCKEALRVALDEKHQFLEQLENFRIKSKMEENQLQQANTTISLLQESIIDLRSRVTRSETTSEQAVADRTKLVVELEASRGKFIATEAEIQKLKLVIEKNETETKSLERLITETTVNMHAREKKIAELKADINAKNNNIDDLRDRISNHAHEKNLMAQRIIAVEKLQRKTQLSLASATLECDRNGMRCSDLENALSRYAKMASTAKQYSELLQEKFEREKQQLVDAHAESQKQLMHALKRAEDSEAAATAYLKSSQDQRPFTQGMSFSRPVSNRFARGFEDIENSDYVGDDADFGVQQRLIHSRPMTGPMVQLSPFPSGRTYGLPNFASPSQMYRSVDLESFEATSRQHTAEQNNQLENRLVALVSVLENRIDKMKIAASLVDELDLEQIEKENGDDEMIVIQDYIEDPEVEAQRIQFEKEQESRLASAVEKLSVLRDHGHVLMKQATELNDTLVAAQQSFDRKSIELRDVKSDYVELQSRIGTMQQQNLAKIEDLKLWETSIMQKRGEPPTEAERMEKGKDLLQSDTQIKEVYTLAQDVSEEIGVLSYEVSSLRDAVNALSLQKGVIEAMIKEHVASEESQDALINDLKRAAEVRRMERIKSLELRAEHRRQQEEKIMKREKKKAELAEKRTNRLQKWRIFNETSRTDAENSIGHILESSVKPAKVVVSSSSQKLLSNDPVEISSAANSIQSVKRKISTILGNIKNISLMPVKSSAHSEESSMVEATEGSLTLVKEEKLGVEDQDSPRDQMTTSFVPPNAAASDDEVPQLELSMEPDSLSRWSHQLDNSIQQYTRFANASDAATYPSSTHNNATAEEALSMLLETYDSVRSLALQVNECKICMDRVSHQIRPQRLAAITEWAAAFEDQWGRRPGPADCRSTGAWSLIEAYLQTQKKEYEMYLEIQSMCNEGRYRVSELQNQLANYKVSLKTLVNSDPLSFRLSEENLPGVFDEAKLPVCSDDIYEFHLIFVPLSLPMHDDPMKTMFSSVRSTHDAYSATETLSQPASAAVVRFLEPKAPEESKGISLIEHANSAPVELVLNSTKKSGKHEAIDDDWLMTPLEKDDKAPGFKSPRSIKAASSAATEEATAERVDKARQAVSEPADPEKDAKLMHSVAVEVESIQNELEEALNMLQDAKAEYRNQLSRQDFAAQEIRDWEVSFCNANPGKVPGRLADDEKRFGGGWSLYEAYEENLAESASLRQRVEILADIAVDKQLQLDDKKDEFRVLKEKLYPSKTTDPLSNEIKMSREGKRVELNDMTIDESEDITLHKALSETSEIIQKLESEIILMENYIGPCEISLEQFKQKKNKLKSQAIEWIRDFNQEHGRTPTDEEKRQHIGFIYADRAELQKKETALTQQYAQAKEILEKLRVALSHKHSRLSLLKSRLK
jgi:hypothetical protein